MGRTTFCLLSVLAVAVPVSAQTPLPPAPREFRFSWIEAGGGITPVVFLGEFVGVAPTLQARVNLFRSLAVELSTHHPGAEGYYDLRLRLSGNAVGGFSQFFTVGRLGSFEFHRIPERRSTLPTGDVVIMPAFDHREITKPFATTIGAGVRVELSRHVAAEASGEIWPGDDGRIPIAVRTVLMVSLGPRRSR